ncbi:MAG: helix-turn-helix domain-containing protein [Pseudomonadota bacterium]
MPTDALATRFAALSHPVRIELLRHIAAHKNCGCKDVMAKLDTRLAQSTVSQHLKVLVEAGLITCTIEHPHSRYNLNEAALVGLSASVNDLTEACCPARCCPQNPKD